MSRSGEIHESAVTWIGWLSVSAGATAQTGVTAAALLGCLGCIVWLLKRSGTEAERRTQ